MIKHENIISIETIEKNKNTFIKLKDDNKTNYQIISYKIFYNDNLISEKIIDQEVNVDGIVVLDNVRKGLTYSIEVVYATKQSKDHKTYKSYIYIQEKPSLNPFKNQKVMRYITNTIVYLLLTVVSVVWLAPLLWITLHAFRGESTGFVTYFLPKQYSFKNFTALFTDPTIPYLKWFTNTLIVATFTSLISTIVVLLTSFTFSRLKFKSRKGFMKLLMILGMFPGFMSMIAIYFILKGFGLLPSSNIANFPVSNYLISLILVNSSGAAMGYLISKGYFDTISRSIDEAAEIDGANKAQIFTHIILPLSKPIIIYTAISSFMGPWGDYIFVTTITGGNRNAWTVARGLYDMINGVGKISSYFTIFSAGALLISVPITLLFIWMQKYYVTGITGGAVKG